MNMDPRCRAQWNASAKIYGDICSTEKKTAYMAVERDGQIFHSEIYHGSGGLAQATSKYNHIFYISLDVSRSMTNGKLDTEKLKFLKKRINEKVSTELNFYENGPTPFIIFKCMNRLQADFGAGKQKPR